MVKVANTRNSDNKKTRSDSSRAEARVAYVLMKHEHKALALAQKIKTSLLKLIELEKTATAEAKSEYASITNTCNIVETSLSPEWCDV